MKRLFLIIWAVCFVCPVLAEASNLTNDARMVDRLKVLRVMAQTIINDTRALNEGESAVVKTDEKTEKQEIDSLQLNDKWKEDISRMGDSIEMNAIPDTLRQIQQNENEQFKETNDRFKMLSSATAPDKDKVLSLRNDAERFSEILKEDSLIVNSIQGKIEKGLTSGSLSASSKSRSSTYMKMVIDCKKSLQKLRSEIARILTFNFKSQ